MTMMTMAPKMTRTIFMTMMTILKTVIVMQR